VLLVLLGESNGHRVRLIFSPFSPLPFTAAVVAARCSVRYIYSALPLISFASDPKIESLLRLTMTANLVREVLMLRGIREIDGRMVPAATPGC
jgi:hypothetical protein